MRYRLIFGAVLVAGILFGVASLHPASAAAATINVTTTTDENSDPVAGTGCSIYEAVVAANTDAAYGGCTAGSGADTVSIPSGTYTMPVGNTWSNNIDVTQTVTLTGPSSGSLPKIDGTAKNAPNFNLSASDISIKNLEFDGYNLENWDNTHANSYPNLSLNNVTMTGKQPFNGNALDTNNDGLQASDITLSHWMNFDIFSNNATVDRVTGSDHAWFETGVDDTTDTGGDNITVNDVNFTDNSNIVIEKNGPGTVLFTDVSIDSPGTDAIVEYSRGSNDDGTTILRRITVTNVVNDDAVLFENDNTTARHVLQIEDSLFEHNSQAIAFLRQSVERTVPTLQITNSVFKDNGPWDSAVELYDGLGYMQISRSSFIGNRVDSWSGAAVNSQGRVDITNSTFYDNSPTPTTGNPGGAIYLDVVTYKNSVATPTPSQIINNTFAGNDAGSGSAIYVADYNDTTSSRDTDVDPLMYNNLFSGNAGTSCQAGSSIFGSSSNSYAILFGAGSDGNIATDSSCDTSTVIPDVKLDSNLTDASTANAVGYKYTGGFMPILKLLVGSPAIDSGGQASCPLVDQRNAQRPEGVGCDVGSYETAALVTPGASDTPEQSLTNTGQSATVASAVAAMLLVVTYGVLAFARRRAKIYRLGHPKY